MLFRSRLKHIEGSPSDPLTADSDGDRVPNDIEFLLGTDPLSFRDRDFDDMPDDWEFRFGLLPDTDDASADFDLDGISNRLEYQTGPGGGDPTDYYNAASPGDLPLIEYISGALQRGDPGTFSAQPLVLKLTRLGAPVGFVPITLFTASASNGQISETNDGNGLTTSLTLRTGADGRVSVYFKHPAAIPVVPLQGRGILARVGSAALGGVSISNSYVEITVYDYTYPPNTVGLSASNAIDSRIAGKTAATALRVFSRQDHNTVPPAYERNILSWCYDLRQQMTCISPWNNDVQLFPGGVTGAGTAITAQHIVNSAHFELSVGTTVRFITANNVVVNRIIKGKARHPDYQPYYPDLTVYTLDSPLPPSITPCKMLPANYALYLSHLRLGTPPVMALDQEEKALVSELYELGNFARYAPSGLHAKRLEFFEELADGDSGDPQFLVIKDPQTLVDTLVLLSTATGHDGFIDPAGFGTFVTPQISALNAMISAADGNATALDPLHPVNTGLQVQTIDLSGFNTYSPP